MSSEIREALEAIVRNSYVGQAHAPVSTRSKYANYSAHLYHAARSALQVEQTPTTVPGYALVPIEPTEEMLEALHKDIRILVDPTAKTADIQNDRAVWSSLIASAPAVSPQPLQTSRIRRYLLDAIELIRECRLADGHAARTGDETRWDEAFHALCQFEPQAKAMLAATPDKQEERA